MARASRWSPARRKDDGVRTRGARPRLGKPKSAAYSPKPNKTTRDIPCGTKTPRPTWAPLRSEEHTSELQSHSDLVCRLLLEKKKKKTKNKHPKQLKQTQN